MIDAEQAWKCILEHVRPGASGRRPFLTALHHYLAVPVTADRDIPACNRAAMDGYAVRANDLTSVPTSLTLAGEVAAGSPSQPAIAAGACVRIFTGAAVPPDSDTVVMQEDTTAEGAGAPGERVEFLQPVEAGRHIFRRGENAREGDILVPAGTRLNAAHAGICATVGCDHPEVHDRPSVAIMATGTELKSASQAVDRHEIRDSNGPMLEAALTQSAFACIRHGAVPDDLDTLLAAFQAALAESDVVLVTGGVSVGKYDLVPEVIQLAGGEICYHGVRIKPGKPQLFASFPDGKCVFGLPGNPLSVMTGLQEFALPALRRLAGCPADSCRPVLRLPLAADLALKGKRQQYVMARLVEQDGLTAAEAVRCAGSSDLVAAAHADGAIVAPVGARELRSGDIIAFRPWGDVA
ncbi:MAG: molybdopterin molybdotransferase MoeA [Verrucomicrobia bacterium]|nr:molybdopterin molybdotransferase MoeA [Verrucomicrobiota bacterium]